MNVILSIKPKYTEKIVQGVKKYEFRKNIPKKRIDKVYIYSSSPQQKIIGYFNIGSILNSTPEVLWEECQEQAGIDKKDFFDYFQGKDTGYALEICNLVIFKQPQVPTKIMKTFTPPQSYLYLK